MKLSPNFTLEELTHTDTGLPNEPDDAANQKLLYLANYILEAIRIVWGPLSISSGYRSEAVNIKIGSKPTSQHCFGEAADIVPAITSDIDDVFGWLAKGKIFFGQAIKENSGGKQWIHISLPRVNKPNNEMLVYVGGVYKPYNRRV